MNNKTLASLDKYRPTLKHWSTWTEIFLKILPWITVIETQQMFIRIIETNNMGRAIKFQYESLISSVSTAILLKLSRLRGIGVQLKNWFQGINDQRYIENEYHLLQWEECFRKKSHAHQRQRKILIFSNKLHQISLDSLTVIPVIYCISECSLG